MNKIFLLSPGLVQSEGRKFLLRFFSCNFCDFSLVLLLLRFSFSFLCAISHCLLLTHTFNLLERSLKNDFCEEAQFKMILLFHRNMHLKGCTYSRHPEHKIWKL